MNITSQPNRANRGGYPHLSSGALRFITASIVGVIATGTSLAFAQPAPGNGAGAAYPPYSAPSAYNPIANAVFEWRTLSQSDSYAFTSYANFLINHPGFPDALAMRKNAERMLRPGLESNDQVIAFFQRYPALTSAGNLRFAEALLAKGMRNEARIAARAAWVGGAITPDDESRVLNSFADAILPGDNDLRMDRLLWDRSTTDAARQLVLVSANRRTVFDARLSMLSKSPDAASKALVAFSLGRNDAGFLADRNWWQRNTLQLAASRDGLAAPRTLSAPPLDPDKWLSTLYATAKAANNDGQFSTVLNIARQLTDTYPLATVVSDRPFSERDNFTNIAWLGGQAALTKLGRPLDAVTLFEAYGNAAKSAQTRSKGLYWAGRAADTAGNRALAVSYYENAGQYFDQFHGQLALERLGRAVAPPLMRRTIEISGSQRDAFENSSLVKAVKFLGAQGLWLDQTKFVRAIANNANTDLDSVLATELAQKISRPDLAVMVGRNARSSGLGDYLRTAFPQLSVPADVAGSWTMIHAITRQESQFDRQIISRAGARGLMQLMPGTARETASKVGVGYDIANLYSPEYNIRLGATYFGQMMDRFSGSYVLAVAAYNAGPGNVNKWLAANGDPRLPGADVIGWIEKIPLSETRNYVQRVLENAVVYDLINPRRPANRAPSTLASYLGRSPTQISIR